MAADWTDLDENLASFRRGFLYLPKVQILYGTFTVLDQYCSHRRHLDLVSICLFNSGY